MARHVTRPMSSAATGPTREERPGRPEEAGGAELRRVVVEHHAQVEVGREEPRPAQHEAGGGAAQQARAQPGQGEDGGGHRRGLDEQQRLRAVVEAQERRHRVVDELHVIGQGVHAHHGVEGRPAVRDQPVRLVEEAQVLGAAAEGPVAVGGLQEEDEDRRHERGGDGPARRAPLFRIRGAHRPSHRGGRQRDEQEEGGLGQPRHQQRRRRPPRRRPGDGRGRSSAAAAARDRRRPGQRSRAAGGERPSAGGPRPGPRRRRPMRRRPRPGAAAPPPGASGSPHGGIGPFPALQRERRSFLGEAEDLEEVAHVLAEAVAARRQCRGWRPRAPAPGRPPRPPTGAPRPGRGPPRKARPPAPGARRPRARPAPRRCSPRRRRPGPPGCGRCAARSCGRGAG